MSEKIYDQKNLEKLIVTSFWGGIEKGQCIEFSCNQKNGYEQLTYAEVKNLTKFLLKWLFKTSENIKISLDVKKETLKSTQKGA